MGESLEGIGEWVHGMSGEVLLSVWTGTTRLSRGYRWDMKVEEVLPTESHAIGCLGSEDFGLDLSRAFGFPVSLACRQLIQPP